MVISLGFPKDKPKKLPRKEVDEITTFVLIVYRKDIELTMSFYFEGM